MSPLPVVQDLRSPMHRDAEVRLKPFRSCRRVQRLLLAAGLAVLSWATESCQPVRRALGDTTSSRLGVVEAQQTDTVVVVAATLTRSPTNARTSTPTLVPPSPTLRATPSSTPTGGQAPGSAPQVTVTINLTRVSKQIVPSPTSTQTPLTGPTQSARGTPASVSAGGTPTLDLWPSRTSSATEVPQPTETLTPTETAWPTQTPWPSQTPRPTNTPEPLFVLLEDEETLSHYVWPTMVPTPTPVALPASLRGRIAFKSDMFDWERIFLVNPDGIELALLLDRWAYEIAQDLQWYAPGGRYRAYQAYGRQGLDLFMTSAKGDQSFQLTYVGEGKAYDPAWSSDGLHIAFASNQEGDDDIFVVHLRSLEHPKPRTEKLIRDSGWESDKHPSYSPDGQQIVFSSNRTGREQLWIMDADGSNLRQLLDVDADCWDPVWFR